jgi:hypothetical protein
MGETVDILLDVTNPGRWMAHGHIAEHHESGMMFQLRRRCRRRLLSSVAATKVVQSQLTRSPGCSRDRLRSADG